MTRRRFAVNLKKPMIYERSAIIEVIADTEEEARILAVGLQGEPGLQWYDDAWGPTFAGAEATSVVDLGIILRAVD